MRQQSIFALHGIKFHLIIQFPDDYPRAPPKISVSHNLPHPFVYGRYICVDMLQENWYHPVEMDEETQMRKLWYTGGWSSCYTIHSILMQLQSFLFPENFKVQLTPEQRKFTVQSMTT